MAKGKSVRTKGKIKFSEYFKSIEEGDNVAIVREMSVRSSFPSRIHGKSGKVIGSRGKSKIIKLNDGNKEKVLVVHPIHLKKL